MMSKRRILTSGALLVILGAVAILGIRYAGSRLNRDLHAFYYPWYGSPAVDGEFRHWNHVVLGLDGPTSQRYRGGSDIAAAYYPALGCYSSADPEVLACHMRWLAQADVGTIVVGWFGRNAHEAVMIPQLLDAAEAEGIRVAFHLEPVPGRDADAAREAIRFVSATYGSHPAFYRHRRGDSRGLFYVYDSYLIEPSEWGRILNQDGSDTIRGTPIDAIVIGLLVDSGDLDVLHASGFDGAYTYFASRGFTFGAAPEHWVGIREAASRLDMLFVPCVGPGYDDTPVRPWNTSAAQSRDGGRYYDEMFRAAVAARPDAVGITSFNEWHEGTQIEPARPAQGRYRDYAPRSPDHYLRLTAHWSRKLRRQ